MRELDRLLAEAAEALGGYDVDAYSLLESARDEARTAGAPWMLPYIDRALKATWDTPRLGLEQAQDAVWLAITRLYDGPP